jgi:aminoglycoside phosphotransferase
MGRADTYSQPDAADPVLSDDLVLGLAREMLPDGVRVTGISAVDESGGEARAYLLDSDRSGVPDGVVVKVQRPHRLRPRTSLAKEAWLLAALARPLRGRIPALFGHAQVTTDVGPVEYLVMSRVPGRALRHVSISAGARTLLVDDVAAVLRAMHSLDAQTADPEGLLPTDPDAAALRRRVELGLADIVDVLRETPDVWTLPVPPAEVADRAVAALPDKLDRTVVLHSNPGPTHVFVTESGTLAGVIDFGDAYGSHPALDLRSWPDPDDRVRLRAAYLDGKPAPAGFDEVWTVAMLHADMAAVAARPELAARAGEDLLTRLAVL